MLHHDLETGTHGGKGSARPRPIFRASALQRYRMRQEKDALPRFLAPPVFLVLWIILGLALLTGVLLWQIRIPVVRTVAGVLLPGGSGTIQALLFVPAEQAALVRAGQTVELQISATGPSLQLVVATRTPQALSPASIRATYGLDNALGLLVRQPAVVATVALPAEKTLLAYAGSLVDARIQTGSQSVLSLFT